MTTTDEKVLDIVATQFSISKRKVKPSTVLADELNMDSLDHVELVMYIEEELGIEILATEDLESMLK